MIISQVIKELRESLDRAESVANDVQSLRNDHSPFDSDEDFLEELRQLKRHWVIEARAISKLADEMMGIK